MIFVSILLNKKKLICLYKFSNFTLIINRQILKYYFNKSRCFTNQNIKFIEQNYINLIIRTMKKSILLFLMLILISSFSFSQSQQVYNKSQKETFLLNYSQNGNIYLNQMLQKLAAANQVAVSSFNINFSYTEVLKIFKRADNLNLVSQLSDLSITGDVKYRNFSVQEFFIPEKVSFKMEYSSGNRIMGTINNQNVSISGNPATIADKNVRDSTNSQNLKLETKDKVFDFTAQNKIEFDAYIATIDAYYSESSTARAKLNSIDLIRSDKNSLSLLPDFNKLYEYRDLSQQTLNYALDVEKKDFYKKLPLENTDPEQLKLKIEKIKSKSRELNQNSIDMINSLDVVYYNKGVEMLSKNNPAQADMFFNKSVEINPNYVPSHIKLATIYYNSGRVDMAMNKVMTVKDFPADATAKNELYLFADGMYKDFLLEAADQNSRNNFDGALASLDRANSLCREFAQVVCRPAMDREYSRAINGKYFAILFDADVQIQKGRLQEAEKIINIALDYRHQNITFIPSNQDVANRIGDLYFSYINSGNRYNSTAFYDRALQDFAEAERICNSYQEINCTVELSKGISDSRNGIYNSLLNEAENKYKAKDFKNADVSANNAISYRNQFALNKNIREDQLVMNIKQGAYDDNISKGIFSSSSNDFQSALNYFNDAKEIQNQYNIRQNTKLSGYISSAAKNLVLNKISAGNQKVDYNDLLSARNLFSEARDLQSNYMLENDKEIVLELGKLKDRIFKQECINAQNKYDILYNDAIAKINSREFISADNLLNQALDHANANSQCMLETKNSLLRKSEIAPAVKFLSQINSSNDYVRKGNYQNAIGLYNENFSYFQSANIAKYGLSCLSTFDWILSQSPNFINYSAGYYISKQEYEKALLCLKNLSGKGFKSSGTKTSQVSLANALAIRDYNENPSSDVYANIARYTNADKFFKIFMKSYKSQWKKLN